MKTLLILLTLSISCWPLVVNSELYAITESNSFNTNKVEMIKDIKKVHIKSGLEIGKNIYTVRCAICHGENGEGDGKMTKIIYDPSPANLTTSTLTDEDMQLIIHEGGEAVGRSYHMPPWKDELSKSEIFSVMNYIKALRQ